MKFVVAVFSAICLGIGLAGAVAAQHSHPPGSLATTAMPSDGPSAVLAAGQAVTKRTEGEQFAVTLSTEKDEPRINVMHAWIVRVATPDGQAVEDAEVAVDGGMPAHGHGLPTAPRVTRYLGDGRYLIEGVKFNMGGHWELKLRITAGGQTDSVTFDLAL